VKIVDFREHIFTSPPERRRLLLAVIERLLAKNRPSRILDVGCGTGAQLIDIAATFQLAQCVGIDLSLWNVANARRMASDARLRLHFRHGDYLSFVSEPFDVILADSVLQNVPVSTGTLAVKLSTDLNPGGLLIVSIPYDCVYNRLIWTSRRVFRLARGPFLERVAVRVARLLHPSWSADMIRERIPYLYLLPERVDSENVRDTLLTAGRLAVLQEQEVPHVSPVQPKHRLVVFRKQPS
jgi:trans-aconitate 2-methyltransferase